jgi:uncharacterized protein YbaR (Trm112 family)
MPVLSKQLTQRLVCPRSKQPLIYFPRGEADRDEKDGFLLSPKARLRYRIENGVPVCLPEEAEELSHEATARLVARAKELGLSEGP